MIPDNMLLWLQIVVSILTLGGVAFAVGRLVGRIDSLEKVVHGVKDSLFGSNGTEGSFLRRSEATLMLENSNREHKIFDDRLTELAGKIERIGAAQRRAR